MIKSIIFDKKVFKNFDSVHLIGTHEIKGQTVCPEDSFPSWFDFVFSVDESGNIHVDANRSNVSNSELDPQNTTIDGKKLN